jgi:hypothetical protein
MSFTQSMLYYIPATLLCIIIVFISIFISTLGLLCIRLIIPRNEMKKHNDVVGSIFATIGVIYAVLLAFMVIVTWQSFDNSQKDVAKEANNIANLYRDSFVFSESFKKEIKIALKNYVNEIINDEWVLMGKGERSQKVQEAQEKLWKLYTTYKPGNETEKVFFEESVKRLNEAAEYRRQRIFESSNGNHPVLYSVLFLGGLLTIFSSMLFGIENFKIHLLMTSILAFLIALILFTIVALDYPFTGSVNINANAFKIILRTLLISS